MQVHVTVRDEDVFVVQSGCGEGAVNDYCMEVTLRTVFVVLTLRSLLRGPYCVFLTAWFFSDQKRYFYSIKEKGNSLRVSYCIAWFAFVLFFKGRKEGSGELACGANPG